MAKVSVHIEEIGSAVHVRATGSLTFMGVPKLTRQLASLPAGRRVFIDLDIDFLDHAGRDALEGWRTSYERTGGQVYIDGDDFRMESSPGIERLVDGARLFERKMAGRYRELFAGLTERQTPHTLFLACSDSRIVPSLLTSTDPGELFVVRNVGNMIPIADHDETPAEAAFAVGVLGVRDIVVCGHMGCGAMRALREGIPSRFPCLARWLKSASADELRQLQEAPDVDEAAKHNVVVQLEHLKSHPIVARRIEAGELRLHGWFFDFRSGALSEWCPEQQQFLPVGAALELHKSSDAHAEHLRLTPATH
jgi:carbonic anhydrase